MKHLKIFLILFILTLIQNSISFKSKYSMSSRNKHKSNLGKFTIKAITNSSAKANFKFLSKNQKNKPKNFKGNVGLEMENKGIVIATALENKKNDKMLKLISEKIASNTYLIDFRLFRSCDMNPKFKKNSENLSVSFSPKSLENKSKTDKFEINVDIKNFRHFIPIEKYSTEKEVKNYLLEICRQRKNSINLLKENFSEKIKNFQENSKKIRKLNSNINTQTIEIKNIKTAVKDTQRQINDINSLRKSYKIQIKSIEQLAKGTKNLIGKETQKSLDLRTKELQTESNLEKKEHQMKTKEEEIFKEKENFHKFIENSKDIENNLIKKQKKISEEENKLSSIQQNKMKISYDLNNDNKNLKKIRNKKINLIRKIKKLKNLQTYTNSNLDKINKEKVDLNVSIKTEKLEIEKIQQKINDLILQKSTNEDNLKTKYDLLNTKEDEISKLKIELDANFYQIKNFEEKKNNIFEKEESKLIKNLNNLKKAKNLIEENYAKTQNKLNKMKLKIQEIFEKRKTNENSSEDNDTLLHDKAKQESKLQLDKNEIERKIVDFTVERKDTENKLKNLKVEEFNYRNEISNINKSLNSATDNLETFNGILNDFEIKLEPLDKKYEEFIDNKKTLKNMRKQFKKEIKLASGKLKRETPSATIMVELAENETFNDIRSKNLDANGNRDSYSYMENDKHQKWKELVDNIIA